MKNVFSDKIRFVKFLTRIVKYESQDIKSNPVGECSTYGTYWGAILQVGDFSGLDTASKRYENSKSVPGLMSGLVSLTYEIFEKFFKVRINCCENFQNLGWHIPFAVVF